MFDAGLVEMLIVLGFALAGGAVGLACRWALARARRPAVLPAGGCAVGTALLAAGVGWRWSAGAWPGWWLPVPLAATVFAVPLALADLRYRRLPDVLTLPAYPVAVLAVAGVALAAPGPGFAVATAGAAALFGGAHLLVHVAAPGALGAGDVKLAGSLGALLGACGWAALAVTAVVAAFAGALLAGIAALAGVHRWRDGVPYGPGLLAGTWLVTVFAGVRTGGGYG